MTGPARRCGITACYGKAVAYVVNAEIYACRCCADFAAAYGCLVLAYQVDETLAVT